jgi:hypothetical protein
MRKNVVEIEIYKNHCVPFMLKRESIVFLISHKCIARTDSSDRLTREKQAPLLACTLNIIMWEKNN